MASRITGLAVAVLATTALAVAASSAKDTTKVETSLNFSFFSNLSEPGPDYFWGRVKAKDPGKKTRCERGRKVTVYGYAHHRRHVIGSDRSNDRGMYKVISSSVYYARLSPFVAVAQKRTLTTDNGKKVVCKAGRSEPIRFGLTGPVRASW